MNQIQYSKIDENYQCCGILLKGHKNTINEQ
jgi:hypothetical protein